MALGQIALTTPRKEGQILVRLKNRISQTDRYDLKETRIRFDLLTKLFQVLHALFWMCSLKLGTWNTSNPADR